MKYLCNKPFAPSKFPIYYGWVILGAGTIGMLMSVPGQTVGVSAFTEDLLNDLQVNRDSLSLAYLVGTIFSGLMITKAGKYYDKYGARIMAFIAGVMLGVILLYLTRVGQIINRLEWRGAWVMLAFMVGILFTLFVLIVFRDNPQSCGLKPDGRMPVRRQRKRPPSLPDKDFTLKEARRTLTFWVFTLALALTSLYVTGLTFHIVSIFESGGMTEDKALAIFFPTSIIAVTVQFAFSFLSDFVKLKYLLILFLSGMLISSFGLFLLSGKPSAYYIVIAGNGIIWGLYSVLIGVTWPRFYGLKHLGAISGFSLSIAVFGSAMGPYLFSLSLKYSGSYGLVALLCIILSVILLFLSVRTDNPGTPAAR